MSRGPPHYSPLGEDLHAAPLGPAAALVEAGVHPEEERERPDQEKNGDDDKLHASSMPPLVHKHKSS